MRSCWRQNTFTSTPFLLALKHHRHLYTALVKFADEPGLVAGTNVKMCNVPTPFKFSKLAERVAESFQGKAANITLARYSLRWTPLKAALVMERTTKTFIPQTTNRKKRKRSAEVPASEPIMDDESIFEVKGYGDGFNLEEELAKVMEEASDGSVAGSDDEDATSQASTDSSSSSSSSTTSSSSSSSSSNASSRGDPMDTLQSVCESQLMTVLEQVAHRCKCACDNVEKTHTKAFNHSHRELRDKDISLVRHMPDGDEAGIQVFNALSDLKNVTAYRSPNYTTTIKDPFALWKQDKKQLKSELTSLLELIRGIEQ